MADLAPTNAGCCAAEVQAECCEPDEKGGCCTPGAATCGCGAGERTADALTRGEFETELAAAGLGAIEIRETHRVHEHAGAAIIRATKPGST
jgi:hypothetical protein